MIQFLGGALVGAVGMQAMKSEKVRNVLVSGLAQGIVLKDAVMEQVGNLKDEAVDICADAKEKAKEKSTSCDCGPDCACGPECDCGPDCDCEADCDCGTDCDCCSSDEE